MKKKEYRKIMLALLPLLAVSLSAKGQQPSDPTTGRNYEFRFGADLGMNVLGLENNYGYYYGNYNYGNFDWSSLPMAGLNVGLGIKNDYNSQLVIETGVNTDVMSSKHPLYPVTYTKYYVGVPFLFGCAGKITDIRSFNVRLGFILFCEVANRGKFKEGDVWPVGYQFLKTALDDERGSKAWIMHLGYGNEWQLTEKLSLRGDLFWQHRFNVLGYWNEQFGPNFRPCDVVGVKIGIGWTPYRLRADRIVE